MRRGNTVLSVLHAFLLLKPAARSFPLPPRSVLPPHRTPSPLLRPGTLSINSEYLQHPGGGNLSAAAERDPRAFPKVPWRFLSRQLRSRARSRDSRTGG